MAKVQVEQNPLHIDDEDMAVIVVALEELGYEAEPTDQQMVLKAAWWVLVLHWLGDDTEHLVFDSLLTAVGARIWRHYRKAGKEPPSRMDVVDKDHKSLGQHELAEPDDEDPSE